MKYLDLEGIKKAFGEHLKKYRGYSDDEAEMATSDFPDPYSNCYLNEDFVEECEIDGVDYEKNISYCDLGRIGMRIPPFCFYTYYRGEDIEDHTVGSYKSARKLFQVEDLELEDFPEYIAEQLENN